MSNKFIPRLHVKKQESISDNEISMDRNVAHYLRTVMRFDLPKPVFLFNDTSGEFSAKISELGKNGVIFKFGYCIRKVKPTTELTLLFAPISKERSRFMIEKATELGVSHFRPVMTDHTNATKLTVPKSLSHAKQAVEQCERLDIPTFDQPERILRVLKNWSSKVPLLYCAESGEGADLTEALEGLKGSAIAVLVGPEGGFSFEEDEFLMLKDFVVPVSLGPRIMRAETAAIAVLSVVQAVVGDWDLRLNDAEEREDGGSFVDNSGEEDDDYGTITV